MKIGIMGCGVVGSALLDYYADKHEVYTYDPKFPEAEQSLEKLNANAEIVFIAVPTPYAGEGKRLDCRAVCEAAGRLTGSKTVIIKSTVNPGVTDNLQELYPEHRFFFVPEFLSEVTAAEDYANPRRPHVVGYTDSWPIALNKKEILPDVERVGSIALPAKQAELLKLATNAFYAIKVTFANQLYDIGITQETLDALAEDPWIVPSHFQIEHKGYRGFGGACLVKDSKALADMFAQYPQKWPIEKQYGYGDPSDSHLVVATFDYNRDILESQGLDWRDFAGCKKDIGG